MSKIFSGHTYLGGMPANTDDLGFIQQGRLDDIKSSLAHLIDGTTDKAVIVSGGTKSFTTTSAFGGIQTITDGVVYWKGELWKFNGTSYYVISAPTSTSNAIWIEDISVDPVGTKLYQDGVTHDTYIIKNAAISAYTQPVPFSSAVIPADTQNVSGTRNWNEQVASNLGIPTIQSDVNTLQLNQLGIGTQVSGLLSFQSGIDANWELYNTSDWNGMTFDLDSNSFTPTSGQVRLKRIGSTIFGTANIIFQAPSAGNNIHINIPSSTYYVDSEAAGTALLRGIDNSSLSIPTRTASPLFGDGSRLRIFQRTKGGNGQTEVFIGGVYYNLWFSFAFPKA